MLKEVTVVPATIASACKDTPSITTLWFGPIAETDVKATSRIMVPPPPPPPPQAHNMKTAAAAAATSIDFILRPSLW